MNCYISGAIGLGLLVASISTMSCSKKETEDLKKVLSPELVQKFNAIQKERQNHYLQGLALGVILSFVMLRKLDANNFTKISLFLTLTLTTCVVYYFLMPKSDYMLNHLRTEKEITEWLAVYKTMKKRYFTGFLLGILASIPIAMIFCR